MDNFNFKVPPVGIKFKNLGQYHLAWLMVNRIYNLKILLFRNQFKITDKEEKSHIELDCFIIKHYVLDWFLATNCEIAPLNDI